MKTKVAFNNVSYNYGNIQALNNLTFEIKEFSSTALVGNNGCGKSTTIHILANLLTYKKGEVYYENSKIDSNTILYKNKLGILLSNPSYIEDLSIIEYWIFVAKFQKVPQKEIQSRIVELINTLELQNDKNKLIKKLSSGNKMKVSFGASIIHNPDMLLLDEPFVHMDISTVETVTNILKSIKKTKTLLISSHSLDLIIDLCSTFLIMDGGRIIEEVHKKDFENNILLSNKVKSLLHDTSKSEGIQWLK